MHQRTHASPIMADFIDAPSPNFNDRPAGRAPDLLVLHYTGMETGAAAIERLCDPAAKVSAHYTVEEDGTVFAHVAEDKRAWHAGVAHWAGESDVNGVSIGIEIVNPGHEFGYRPFPAVQIDAVIALAREIVERHGIPPHRVVGHSDVAPDRKQDPGELFPWPLLAAAGVGLFPRPAPDARPEAGEAERLLRRIGYGVGEPFSLADVLSAFQRRFRPSRIDAALDAETAGLIAALAAALPVPD